MSEFDEMDDDERKALALRAGALMQSIGGLSGPKGEMMPCPQCGTDLRVKRDGSAWNAECNCGWEAAGFSKRSN